MSNRNVRVTIRLDDHEKEKLTVLIKKYGTKSKVIRAALKKLEV